MAHNHKLNTNPYSNSNLNSNVNLTLIVACKSQHTYTDGQ